MTLHCGDTAPSRVTSATLHSGDTTPCRMISVTLHGIVSLETRDKRALRSFSRRLSFLDLHGQLANVGSEGGR